MDEKFLIHVDIGHDTYNLRIRREDEELFREATKQLRIMLDEFRQRYNRPENTDEVKFMKDLLAMIALQLSADKLCLQGKNDTAPFADKLQQLTEDINVCLEKQVFE